MKRKKKSKTNVDEMEQLLIDKDEHVPHITDWLIKESINTKLPTPVFWYFVLTSAMRIMRQNLREETYKETIECCAEDADIFVKEAGVAGLEVQDGNKIH